jgi:hypothetical protein
MLQASGLVLAKKRFVRISQDRVIRVSNFPLQFKTLTRRKLPDEEYWQAKEEAGNRRRLLCGRGKQGSFPAWFKRGEIEGANISGYLDK